MLSKQLLVSGQSQISKNINKASMQKVMQYENRMGY